VIAKEGKKADIAKDALFWKDKDKPFFDEKKKDDKVIPKFDDFKEKRDDKDAVFKEKVDKDRLFFDGRKKDDKVFPDGFKEKRDDKDIAFKDIAFKDKAKDIAFKDKVEDKDRTFKDGFSKDKGLDDKNTQTLKFRVDFKGNGTVAGVLPGDGSLSYLVP